MDLTTLERLPMWIGGSAYAPTTTRYGEVTNPATGEVIRHVPFANAADVDAAVASAAHAFGAWRDARTAPCARADEVSRPAGPAPQGPGEDRHAGARQDTGRCRRVESRAAWKWSSSPRAFRICLRASISENVGTDVDSWSMRQPRRRVRRHHAVQFPGDGADVDVSDGDRVRQHVRAEAVGARPDAVAAPGRAAAGGGPAGRRVQRRSRRQGGGRRAARASGGARPISFVGSTPIAKYIYETGARNGKRVQALGGAKNHAVVHAGCRPRFRDRSDHRRRLRLGRRALHGHLRGRCGRRRRRPLVRSPRRARAQRHHRPG